MLESFNSNGQFEMDESFQLSFVHVRRSPVGTGRKKKGLARPPVLQTVERAKEKLHRDATRRRVTVCDVHNHHRLWSLSGWHQLERVPKVDRPKRCVRRRDRAARALLRLHPCPYGYQELTRLATAPSLYDYTVRTPTFKVASSSFSLMDSFVFFFRSSWWTPTAPTHASRMGWPIPPRTSCSRTD